MSTKFMDTPKLKPLHIFILGLDGFDVRKIDDIEYTVEISCYFLTKWRDDRLILHEDIQALNEVKNDTAVEETWFPIDLEFVSKVRRLKSISFKKGAKKLQLHEICGIWPRVT